ncbi:MAG: FAD:protein FMN transferase [Woeseia sp.]
MSSAVARVASNAGNRPASADGDIGRQAGRDRNVRLQRARGYWSGTFRAMASPCEFLTRTGSEARALCLAQLVAAEAWRIEDKFSRYLSGNIVDAINSGNGRPVQVDLETAGLLDFAQTLYALSDGRFDISSGVLRRAWNFDGSDRLPTRVQVEDALRNVGWHRADWTPPTLRLQAGMQIDFGGVAKEYAVDRAAKLVGTQTRAGCMINFGGDLAVVGTADNDGPWRVGIESPLGDRPDPERVINLYHGALATSGDARRYVIRDGVRYGHVLDALTGWPVIDAPRSITVAADTCTQAGMLATLAMLMGDEAEVFLGDQSIQYWTVR